MVELLAPAGSYEAFEGALGAGADAVYVGGSAFGARAYAKNFTQEELLTAIDTAHIHGKKLYLTVNTLVKNKELSETLYEYLRPYYERGLDGVIVQDLGVLKFIRENFPGLPIHASTQMTVTGPEGMKFLEKQGVKRVVTARELSLEEIARMHQASSLEIEVFVHGALCYCYSGQCLFSSLLGGRSGNRGRCAQPCRLPYDTALNGKRFSNEKDLCPLSPKDICTIDLLPEILESGVASLKIEGRMKKTEYTAGVVSVYRKYLDLYEKNPSGYQVSGEDRRFLLDIFNRGGSCEGYFRTHGGPEMMAFANEKKSANISVPMMRKKTKIRGELMLYPDSPAVLEVTCREAKAVITGGMIQKAKKQPMDKERILQQMNKCGNSPFEWDRLEISMGEEIFVPVKELNELRRAAFAALEEELLVPYRRTGFAGNRLKESEEASRKMPKETEALPKKPSREIQTPVELYASCESLPQMEVLEKIPEIKGIYAPAALLEGFLSKNPASEKELFLVMPSIVRGALPEEFWSLVQTLLEKGVKGFLVSNLEAYAMLKERGYVHRCVGDHMLYTWNDQAVDFWRSEGLLRNTAPVELNYKELLHRDNQSSELLVYGYLPLMVSAQCVRKNRYGCNGKGETLRLRDRYGKEFPVVCCCEPWGRGQDHGQVCYNKIYNSLPMGLLKEKDQVTRLGIKTLRLSFTLEDAKETGRIVSDFVRTYIYGEDAGEHDFTKGHFKRGVE